MLAAADTGTRVHFPGNRLERLTAAQKALHAQADANLADRVRVVSIPQLFILVLFGLAGRVAWDLPAVFYTVVACQTALVAGRLHLAGWRGRAPSSLPDSFRHWIAAAVIASATGWSSLLAVIFSRYEIHSMDATLALPVLIALCAGAMATLVSHFALLCGFMAILVTPSTGVLLARGGEYDRLVAAGLLVFSLAHLMQGRRLNTTFWSGLEGSVLLSVKLQELDAAHREAEHAHRAQREFLANISHELRTPMNGVLGMTELALDTPLNAEQRDYLLTAQESAQALHHLLNEVLDLSNVEAGRLELEPEHFDLREPLEELRRSFARAAALRSLAIDVSLDPAIPPRLIGDAGRLRQVLTHLVSNALKFTEQGGVHVDATLLSSRRDRAQLLFQVRDTGIGIPAEMQEAIFESFVQVDGSLRRSRGGAGLGLTISSRLVQLMGGFITVESTPGCGATFRFTAEFDLPPAPHTMPQGTAETVSLALGPAPSAHPARHLNRACA